MSFWEVTQGCTSYPTVSCFLLLCQLSAKDLLPAQHGQKQLANSDDWVDPVFEMEAGYEIKKQTNKQTASYGPT